MAKVIRHLREGQTEFQKLFAALCDAKSSWQVWSDFVEMVAISIANSCELRTDVKQRREERYLNIIRQYSKGEQAVFPQLFAILVAALERNPEQDFLGEMFMAMELGNHWKGQFFTPYSVCKAMASINLEDARGRVAKNGYISVNDPACGAGATLIAARNAFELAGIGGSQVFFVGQDIDRTAGMMCYVQLSLLGCAGYVVIADTLTNPVVGPLLWPDLNENQEAWFMPLNFMDPSWAIRISRTWRGLDAENIGCRPEAAAPLEEQEPVIHLLETEVGQLALF